MAKQHRVTIRGEQREHIDADLMAQLVVMLGRQLADDARQAVEAARAAEMTGEHRGEAERPAGEAA